MAERRKQGTKLSPDEVETIRNMLANGCTHREIIRCVGCCRETITAHKHKLAGTKPKKQRPGQRGFLTQAHVDRIGEAEADLIIAYRVAVVRYIGWRDGAGVWHGPKK